MGCPGRWCSPSLEASKKCVDVALRDKVSGHDGSGLGLELMILEVFSSLYDSMNYLLDSFGKFLFQQLC